MSPPHGPAAVVGANQIADEVWCDSGSFLFLPIREDQPPQLETELRRLVAERNGAAVQLPPGRYRLFYEQHDPPAGWPKTFARNIVACRQPVVVQFERSFPGWAT